MMHAVEVTAQQLGEVRTGGWCDPCALPSVLSAEFVISIGLATLEVRTFRQCDECGETSQERHRPTVM